MNNKRNPKGRTCSCGRPAIRYKDSGFVCERCDGLEKIRHRNDSRRTRDDGRDSFLSEEISGQIS